LRYHCFSGGIAKSVCASATGIGTPGISVVAGDFDGDGKLDLAVAIETGEVGVLLGNGDGTLRPPMTPVANPNPGAMVAGDFNRDGKLDVVATVGDGSVSLWLGNGDGTLQALVSYVVGANAQSLVAADFDLDGKLDVVVTTGGRC
jgi:hypothetical protein